MADIKRKKSDPARASINYVREQINQIEAANNRKPHTLSLSLSLCRWYKQNCTHFDFILFYISPRFDQNLPRYGTVRFLIIIIIIYIYTRSILRYYSSSHLLYLPLLFLIFCPLRLVAEENSLIHNNLKIIFIICPSNFAYFIYIDNNCPH